MITTDRMKIYPISIEKLKEIVENEKNEILKLAYQEMLEGCIKNPEDYIWYTLWFIELKDSANEIVGSLSFKGMNGIYYYVPSDSELQDIQENLKQHMESWE